MFEDGQITGCVVYDTYNNFGNEVEISLVHGKEVKYNYITRGKTNLD